MVMREKVMLVKICKPFTKLCKWYCRIE